MLGRKLHTARCQPAVAWVAAGPGGEHALQQHAKRGWARTGGRPQAPGEDVDHARPRAQLDRGAAQHPLLALAVRALQHALPVPLLVVAVARGDGLACQVRAGMRVFPMQP